MYLIFLNETTFAILGTHQCSLGVFGKIIEEAHFHAKNSSQNITSVRTGYILSDINPGKFVFP